MVSINRRCAFIFLLIVSFSFKLSAQQKNYIVFFTDKKDNCYSVVAPQKFLSEKSIQRRLNQNILITEQDLPVSKPYTDSIRNTSIRFLYSLKWFNAAVVSADAKNISEIEKYSFVKSYHELIPQMHLSMEDEQCNFYISTLDSGKYGSSYNQIQQLEVHDMHKEGIDGNGILIALFDGGFQNANSISSLNHLFTENKILATYDFVDEELDVYDDDDHGLKVLSAIAGYHEGELIGSAYNASFVLLRTENGFSETTLEEVNWAKGAEYADSIGVDIISSSLGYSTFDDGIGNYTYADMNGNTAICTKAADWAASKGILVLSSAGNEGTSSWKYITAPADGDSVLAIGAVNEYGNYAFFSSIGPSADGRIKPDLAAKGQSVRLANAQGGYTFASGTSFSCPLLAGLAAGVWQKYPYLTNMELKDALVKSATQYGTPDGFLGYGIPRYTKVKDYILNKSFYTNEEVRIFPNPIQEGNLKFMSGISLLNEEVEIQVVDMLGKVVATDTFITKELSNETAINTTFLEPGLYYLQFNFRDKIKRLKFIKH